MGGYGALSDERKDLRRSKADLVAELSHLRRLLRQAGIDAQASLDEAAAVERQHARELESERAETHAARGAVDEVRHRLKNTLAVVQAIAHVTLRSGKPHTEAVAAFNARLEAMAHAHDVLFESSWASANLASVIEGILSPYARSSPNRVRARGPRIDLSAERALALALTFHELGTNAVKYGALSNDGGYVEIAWALAPVAQGQELRLRWHERNGPPVDVPTRRGFGTRLIETNLATVLQGSVTLDYRPDGLACTICVPV